MFNKAEKILAKLNKKRQEKEEKRGKDMFGNAKEKVPGEEEEEEEGIEFGEEDGEGLEQPDDD